MNDEVLVRIVDDDPSIRSTLEYMLRAEGWKTASYPGATEFLTADAPSVPGCLILDVRMDGMSGLELQQELNRRGSSIPIIFYSAHGDIEMAVDAVKSGAENFLPKTVSSEKLLQSVARAVNESLSGRPGQISPKECLHRWSLLTDREKDVAELIAQGRLNRDITRRLGIAMRTVYVYRVSIYRKLEVRTSAEIARFLELVHFLKEKGSIE